MNRYARMLFVAVLTFCPVAFGQQQDVKQFQKEEKERSKTEEKAAKDRAKEQGDSPVTAEISLSAEKLKSRIFEVMTEYRYEPKSQTDNILIFSRPATYAELPFFMVPVGNGDYSMRKEIHFTIYGNGGTEHLSSTIKYVLDADHHDPQETVMNGNWRWRQELETIVKTIGMPSENKQAAN
jgi:hypothetical protein